MTAAKVQDDFAIIDRQMSLMLRKQLKADACRRDQAAQQRNEFYYDLLSQQSLDKLIEKYHQAGRFRRQALKPHVKLEMVSLLLVSNACPNMWALAEANTVQFQGEVNNFFAQNSLPIYLKCLRITNLQYGKHDQKLIRMVIELEGTFTWPK